MMTRLKLRVIGGNLNSSGRAKKGAVLSSQSALVTGGPILIQGQRWSTSRKLLFRAEHHRIYEMSMVYGEEFLNSRE
jgi:hypothetical protein